MTAVLLIDANQYLRLYGVKAGGGNYPPLPQVQDAAWMIAAKLYPEYLRNSCPPFVASTPLPLLEEELARSANAPPSPDGANGGQDT